MSELPRFPKQPGFKHIETQLGKYKTILNTKEVVEPKTFYKDTKHTTSVDKRVNNFAYGHVEKKIANITSTKGGSNTRSTSAIRRKRQNGSVISN